MTATEYWPFMSMPASFGYLLASAGICIGFVGCSASPSDPTDVPLITRPGTRFIFSSTQMDSSDVTRTSTSLDTQYYFATGLSVGGKTNVVRYGDQDTDYRTAFFSIDPNGDVESALNKEEDTVSWLRIPIGSRGSTFIPSEDTTYSSGERYRTSGGYTYEGTEQLLLCGINYNAIRIRLDLSDSSMHGSDSSANTSRTHIWWIPKIQFVGKRVSEEVASHKVGSNWSTIRSNSTEVLIQYDPK